jgi:hypothetical protein
LFVEVLMVIVVEKVADVGVVDASELGHPTRRSGGGLLRSTPETSRRLSSQIAKSPDSRGRFSQPWVMAVYFPRGQQTINDDYFKVGLRHRGG